ncbi:MAG: glycosyltransferase [Candidatus Methanoplasma sp.]|jgi:cellulose synthase/poly-beta-1,6-N-acetylglucosamine synthase-like glycosyltransferase|nr:glycosyltransferase [Candidatus Methanoplasma sp.]
MDDIISATVGICAYNEEKNIENAVRSVFCQDADGISIEEVVVVCSGCTDGTDDTVRLLCGEYPTLRLIVQEKREGKNSAMNCMLDARKGTDVVVMLNADNVLSSKTSLSVLLRPFRDPKVGIAGGHPIPVNGTDTVAGYASNLIWSMHHYISLSSPKIGELIAFRDIGTRLSPGSQSDEDTLKMGLEERGYVSVYTPDATVSNRGPMNVSDFIKQRTRVNIGELYMKKEHRFATPTWDARNLCSAMLHSARDLGHPIRLSAAIALEIYSKLKAYAYVKMDKGDMNMWDQVGTTKKV